MSNTSQKTILIHYGEIGLKGKNQADFLRRLIGNINSVIAHHGVDSKVLHKQGYIYVPLSHTVEEGLKPSSTTSENLINHLKRTPGIVWFAIADTLLVNDATPEQITKLVLQKAQNVYEPNQTFVVRVKRSNKAFPISSSELEAQLGADIIAQTKWEKVQLKNPDKTFALEIRNDFTFFYTEKIVGAGGLPVGSAERVLSLLSGGIDSPVASYLMARRGCTVDFVHFTATPLQQKDAEQYKVTKLAAQLSETTGTSTLYLIPYTHYAMALMDKKVDYDLVMFRRFMVRVAQKLTEQTNAMALITGDNLAQVASQTLPNIVSTDKAVSMPILRPLIGFDKTEIIEIAKQINTFNLSIEPYKDCCSIISQKPRTRSKHEVLEHIEEKVFDDYSALVEKTIADATVVTYKQGKPVQ